MMMKKLISCFLIPVYFSFVCAFALADDQVDELRKIGEQIKQAVKAGKISEKESWSKWDSVLSEYEVKRQQEIADFNNIEELKEQIEVRELRFELDRMVHEHEIERLRWEQKIERMEQDFKRERRLWQEEQMHWEEKYLKSKGYSDVRLGHRIQADHSIPTEGSSKSDDRNFYKDRSMSAKK